LSQSELPLTFGLGKPGAIKTIRLQIQWPSGRKDSIADIKPNQSLTIQESKGITVATPIHFAAAAAKPLAKP
jgi:hypothetical protein